MNKHHLEEGHSIHHVGNVYALCCDCGCCHSAACEDFSRPCFAAWGDGECLDGMTNTEMATFGGGVGSILTIPQQGRVERLLDY